MWDRRKAGTLTGNKNVNCLADSQGSTETLAHARTRCNLAATYSRCYRRSRQRKLSTATRTVGCVCPSSLALRSAWPAHRAATQCHQRSRTGPIPILFRNSWSYQNTRNVVVKGKSELKGKMSASNKSGDRVLTSTELCASATATSPTPLALCSSSGPASPRLPSSKLSMLSSKTSRASHTRSPSSGKRAMVRNDNRFRVPLAFRSAVVADVL